MVTPDLEYHYHVGSKPVTGPEGLGRFLDNYWGRSKDGVWKIDIVRAGRRQAADGRLGGVHRHDQRGIVSMNRYMGVMEFRDGKIARWRDYFQLNRPPAA